MQAAELSAPTPAGVAVGERLSVLRGAVPFVCEMHLLCTCVCGVRCVLLVRTVWFSLALTGEVRRRVVWLLVLAPTHCYARFYYLSLPPYGCVGE